MSLGDDLDSKLAELEAASASLEPSPEERGRLFEAVVAHVDDMLAGLADGPTYKSTPDDGRELLDSPIGEDGRPIEKLIGLVDRHVNGTGIDPSSPRFFGYIPGGGLPASGLGDLMAAIGNRYSGVLFAAPGATRMENQVVRWIADVVGYPPEAGGYLASGGSMATLSAVVAARDAHGVVGAAVDEAVLYLTDHAHHCIDKALHFAGVAGCTVRRVPVDDRQRMRVDALAELVAADRAAGLRPWMVVGTAGTTNTGTIDPLVEIADVATAEELWFHVDAAYGGFFVLTPERAWMADGMSRADSLVLDPHKTLFVPYGTGAVLVRDHRHLLTEANADYLQDIPEADELSPADVSPELTKHFRGLRVWLPLQLCGVAAFRAALSEKLALARYFHAAMTERDGWEVGPEPDLAIVTFRYVPATGDADVFNDALVKAMHADGRIFCSSTRVDGRFVIRMAIGSFRSHRRHVDLAIDVLTELAAKLEAGAD